MKLPEELATVLPADFVRARDALARKLRETGRSEEAKALAALRKPSPALWIANQLGKAAPGEIEALIASAERLRDAQVRGGGDLRDAMQAQRQALQRAAEAAARIAEQLGARLTPELARRVHNTVQSAALSEPSALREGALERELGATGFEDLLGGAPLPPPHRMTARGGAARPGEASPVSAKENRQREAQARREHAHRLRVLRRADHSAQALRQKAISAERDAEQARKRAEAAQQRAVEARRAAEEAATRALELRKQA